MNGQRGGRDSEHDRIAGGPSAVGVGDELQAGSPSPSRVSRLCSRVPATGLLVVIAVVLLLTTKPWQSSTAARTQPNSSPTFPAVAVEAAPAVDQCHNYDFRAFSQPVEDGSPVPCTAAHDAITVAVLKPKGVPIPFDASNRASQAALAKCQPPVDRLTGVGAGVEFSEFLGAVYEPSGPQQMAGQRWLRCDLVEVRPDAGRLQPLTDQYSESLVAGPDLRDALCVHQTRWTSRIGGDPTVMGWSNLASCSRPGAAVAIRTAHAASSSSNWPGQGVATDAAQLACRDTSPRFVNLKLHSLPAARTTWPTVLCVADVGDYRQWVTHGKQLSNSG